MKGFWARPWSGIAVMGLCAAALMGCGTERPKPTPLEKLAAPRIAGRQVWNYKVDGAPFALSVASKDGQFFLASGDHTVVALRASDGHEMWRAKIDGRISAGVGSDGRFASVVTRNNEVLAIDAGKVRWRQQINTSVVAAPFVAGERIFVVGIDRSVHAFDALDGRRLWVLRRPGDPLTLEQPSVIGAHKDTLWVGQGVRITGVDPLKGTVRWEAPVASPRGTNEVERLSDIVGPALRVGDTICARAFQVGVGCVDAARGTLVWTKNTSGLSGVGGDAQFVFAADSADRITAWKTSNGDVAWTHDRLAYRGLAAPVSAGKAVIFADSEGQVHFLSREDGSTLLRLPTDGSAVRAQPVLSGDTVLVVTRNGGLFGFRPE